MQDVYAFHQHQVRSHLAVCVYLMKGKYDDSLKWPFRGEVTIQLPNQGDNNGGHQKQDLFDGNTPSVCCERVNCNTVL